MSFPFSRTLTIASAQCGASDSTNFPVLIQGTLGSLATVANGGHVQNASGYDLVVTSDLAGTSLLNFERVLYVPATGQFVLFGKLPTLSHTVDSLLYLNYGNAAITTDQQNASGTWDSNYKAVYHLSEAAHPYNDSTSNANNSGTGTDPTQVAGLIGNAQSFAGGSSQSILTPSGLLASTTNFTVSGWLKIPDATRYGLVWDGRSGGSVGQGLLLYTIITSGFASLYINVTSAAGIATTGSTNLGDNAWHYLVGVYDGSVFRLYVDGAQVASTTHASSALPTANTGSIGKSSDATPLYTTGLFQENRWSNAARSADWILAEYNNQKAGSTFLTIGPEVGGGQLLGVAMDGLTRYGQMSGGING